MNRTPIRTADRSRRHLPPPRGGGAHRPACCAPGCGGPSPTDGPPAPKTVTTAQIKEMPLEESGNLSVRQNLSDPPRRTIMAVTPRSRPRSHTERTDPMRTVIIAAAVAATLTAPRPAHAHFLWLKAEPGASRAVGAHICSGEAPEPGEPDSSTASPRRMSLPEQGNRFRSAKADSRGEATEPRPLGDGRRLRLPGVVTKRGPATAAPICREDSGGAETADSGRGEPGGTPGSCGSPRRERKIQPFGPSAGGSPCPERIGQGVRRGGRPARGRDRCRRPRPHRGRAMDVAPAQGRREGSGAPRRPGLRRAPALRHAHRESGPGPAQCERGADLRRRGARRAHAAREVWGPDFRDSPPTWP